jgi:hypothetical protein
MDLGLKPGLLGEKPASNHFTFSECRRLYVYSILYSVHIIIQRHMVVASLCNENYTSNM